MEKTERRRSEISERKEVRKKETKKRKKKNNRSKKSGWIIGDLRWKRKGQEISSSKVPQGNPYLWKENKWEDANKEVVKLCKKGFVPRKKKV